MIRKIGNFPYDISKFEKEAKKLFGDEDIIVGAIDGADEAIIQKFLDDVLDYEINARKLDKKNEK